MWEKSQCRCSTQGLEHEMWWDQDFSQSLKDVSAITPCSAAEGTYGTFTGHVFTAEVRSPQEKYGRFC